MIRLIYRAALLLIVMIFTSCEWDYNVDDIPFAPRVVVSSVLTAGEPIGFSFYYSKKVGDNKTPLEYVKGVVKIYEDDRLVVDERYENEQFVSNHIAKSGARYRLEMVSDGGEMVGAETYVPQPSSFSIEITDVREDYYRSYYHILSPMISVRDESTNGLWVAAKTIYADTENRFSTDEYSDSFFATNSFFDQVNSTYDTDKALFQGATVLYEQFIRIYPSDVSMALPARFSFRSSNRYYEKIDEDNVEDDYYEDDRAELFPSEIVVELISASAEWDKFYRSCYKQSLYSFDVVIPLFHQNIYIESNVVGGTGIFAGRSIASHTIKLEK